ncbi:MAG: PAS domain-containing protein [Candidatus Paceibacterota bacterium]|jgi:PAS domain S-box-containing protein
MKKTFLSSSALALVLFLSAQNSFAAEARVIKVGAFNNYPVIFPDTDGTMRGLYVDLLSEIGKKENITFTYVLGTWNEGLDRIKSGEIDLITSVGYTQERALFLSYAQNPVLTVWGELYALPSSKIDSILEVSNKTIGVLSGDINATNFRTLLSQFNITSQFIEFSTYDNVFKAIAEKKIDAGVAGITFGLANEMKYGLASTGIVFNPLNLYFAGTKDKNSDLLPLIDGYLNEWKQQESSPLSQAKLKWLHGRIESVPIIPSWIKNILILLGSILIIAFVFITILRVQIKKATYKIKEEEKKLWESEWRSKNIIENLNDAIFMLDRDYKYLTVNTTLANNLGKPPEEIVGKSVSDIFPEEVATQLLANINRVFETGKTLSLDENITIQGEKIYHNSRLNPVKNESGKVIAVAGIIRDMSENKKKEDELKQLNELMVGRELKMAELKNKINKQEKGDTVS